MQQVDVHFCSRFLLQICSRRYLVYVSLCFLKYRYVLLGYVLLAIGDAVAVGGGTTP